MSSAGLVRRITSRCRRTITSVASLPRLLAAERQVRRPTEMIREPGAHGTDDLRTQLSLYVPAALAAELAAVRRAVDPVQSRLIPPHVTLCREEDLVGLSPDTVGARLAGVGRLTLALGPAERFGGHGILLPCVAG